MASQTTQLIVELLDRVSGPARGVGNSLRGLTRTVRDATGAPVTVTFERPVAASGAAQIRVRRFEFLLPDGTRIVFPPDDQQPAASAATDGPAGR